jgi:hypothetical protein
MTNNEKESEIVAHVKGKHNIFISDIVNPADPEVMKLFR